MTCSQRSDGTRSVSSARAWQKLCCNFAIAAFGIVYLTLLEISGSHAATLTEHMEISCVQDPYTLLSCDYRLLSGGKLASVSAEANGQIVAGELTSEFLDTGSTASVLILVDTSDPGRAATVREIAQQLEALLQATDTHHRLGLASFDTDLYLLADIGTSHDDLRRAFQSLEAKGRTTELYRNVLEAIRLIAKDDSARKNLIIFSDGLAEDFAYHHADVIALARENNVTIHSLGYPRSVAQSVALQTIRRLSDETGGIYTQANHVDYGIPADVFERVIAASDSGGSLTVDLQPLIDAGLSGPIDLSLAFQTADQSFIAIAPIRLPGGAMASTAGSSAELSRDNVGPVASQQPPPTFTPPQSTAPQVASSPTDLWPWFATLLTITLLILVAVLFVWLRLRRGTPVASESSSSATALAYLVALDDASTRHAVDKTPWRIGRGRNNDLTVADHSVSRLHAEIRTTEEGQLQLNDLESLNGVFVNDNRIENIQLREGDNVDIGDVRFIFTLHDEDYASEEPTVMVRTRTPI